MILWIPAAAAALASALFTALDAAVSFARMEPQERAQPASPGSSSDDEARFVERLRRGDDDAFESLVRDHAGRMLAVAKRFLPNEEDAMDAVQESFLSVHKSIERFSGGSKLSTWVHRIVVNSCLMKLRTKRSRPEKLIDDLLPQFENDGHFAEPPAAWDARADSPLVRDETRSIVRRAIDLLPESSRTVLLLRDIEELDTEETARVLGITPNAAKIRLHRAHQALRTLLDRQFRVSRS